MSDPNEHQEPAEDRLADFLAAYDDALSIDRQSALPSAPDTLGAEAQTTIARLGAKLRRLHELGSEIDAGEQVRSVNHASNQGLRR